MPYTKYARMFVNSDGEPLPSIEVPESCIDSAEYIIRTIATGGVRLTRGRVGPQMKATFGNLEFNASTDDFLANTRRANSYNFNDLPKVGEGIVLLNKTAGNLDYNMHFGAILARKPGEAIISHMFQVVKSPSFKPLAVLQISSVDDFATQTFGTNANLYAIGLLTALPF